MGPTRWGFHFGFSPAKTTQNHPKTHENNEKHLKNGRARQVTTLGAPGTGFAVCAGPARG